MIDFQIDDQFSDIVDLTLLEKAVNHTLQTVNLVGSKPNLTIVVTNNDAVQQLNHDYRGIDAVTDVLSFANDHDDMFITPDDESEVEDNYLGDIIIAYPVAVEQAQKSGHATIDELLLLTVHGTLHLLGFDHNTPTKKADMWVKQKQVMTALGLAQVQPTE
ncbi:rRNA maturation RNase YbeY [Anaerolineales bacterium HSG6]|nr:rRNA maturation RNase YbeY [Anaerolineales bacterium HSG6]MDM8531574.1 rRNA maturation RNase YbeY [Anaerolineales bacterium HSG25]